MGVDFLNDVPRHPLAGRNCITSAHDADKSEAANYAKGI